MPLANSNFAVATFIFNAADDAHHRHLHTTKLALIVRLIDLLPDDAWPLSFAPMSPAPTLYPADRHVNACLLRRQQLFITFGV